MITAHKTKSIGLIATIIFIHIALLYGLRAYQKNPMLKPPISKVIVTTVQLCPKEITPPLPQSENKIEQTPKEVVAIEEPPLIPLKSEAEIIPPNPEPAILPKKEEKIIPKPTPNPKVQVKKENPPKKESKPKPPKPPEKKAKAETPIVKKNPEPKVQKTIEKTSTPSAPKAKPVVSKATSPPQVKKVELKKEPSWTKEQEALLKSVQESISSLESAKPSSKTTTLSDSPKQIVNLGIDQSLRISSQKSGAAMEASYKEELIRRLKLLLKMPEIGEVKIQLTIEREGKILKVAILHADSEKNRLYVEKTLSSLTMPVFGDRFKDKSQHTFPVTLSNE